MEPFAMEPFAMEPFTIEPFVMEPLRFDLYLPCGGEVVLLLIDDLLLEDITSLLSGTLAQEVVVDLDVGDVSLVAWDHS